MIVQKHLVKLCLQEANKDEDNNESKKQNKQLMNQLAKTINDGSKMLAELGMSPIILAKVFTLIPKELIQGDLDYVNKHFNNMDKDRKFLWSGTLDTDEDNSDKE